MNFQLREKLYVKKLEILCRNKCRSKREVRWVQFRSRVGSSQSTWSKSQSLAVLLPKLAARWLMLDLHRRDNRLRRKDAWEATPTVALLRLAPHRPACLASLVSLHLQGWRDANRRRGSWRREEKMTKNVWKYAGVKNSLIEEKSLLMCSERKLTKNCWLKIVIYAEKEEVKIVHNIFIPRKER